MQDTSNPRATVEPNSACLDASGINEMKAEKKTDLATGVHLQHECKSDSNNKFQNKPATQEKKQKQAAICSQWEHHHSGVMTNNIR